MIKECKLETCHQSSRRNGLCSTHSSRLRKHGDPLEHVPIVPSKRYDAECSVEGCHGKHDMLSYCNRHAQRFQRYGDPLGGGKERIRNKGRDCLIDTCYQPAKTRGYCSSHYRRVIRHGDPLAGKLSLSKRPLDIPNDHKWCSRCQTTKFLSVENFGYDKNTIDGRAHWCKRCYLDARLQRTYRITATRYDKMLADQGGGCATCGERLDPYVRVSRLSVDHDHSCCPGLISCGKCVRGLLCTQCNHTLGTARDDVDVLARMIEYLNFYKDRENYRGRSYIQTQDYSRA